MTRHFIGVEGDIAPGTRKIVEVDGKSIGVYNVRGQFYAIRNFCPHQGAGLCEGITASLVLSEKPGEFEYAMEGEVVRCPWHFWEFDVKTGHMVVDPKVRTRRYDVTVEKFDVSVDEGKLYIEA